jgi:hypothetical protein
MLDHLTDQRGHQLWVQAETLSRSEVVLLFRFPNAGRRCLSPDEVPSIRPPDYTLISVLVPDERHVLDRHAEQVEERFFRLPSGAAEVAARTGRSRRAVERAIRMKSPTTPHGSSRAEYVRVASEWAAERLGGVWPSRSGLGTLYCYWRSVRASATASTCACGCGESLPTGRRKWVSEAHRKRAARARKA